MRALPLPNLIRSKLRFFLVLGVAAGILAGVIVGNAAAQLIYCGGVVCTGTEASDRMYGTSGYEQIYAYSNRDLIQASGSGDVLFGGPDGDAVWAGPGNDIVHCEAGNENWTVAAGEGTTSGICIGNENGDEVFGGVGEEEVKGGWGVDLAHGMDDFDYVSTWDMDGGGWADTARGGAFTDHCTIDKYDSAFECETVVVN